MGYGIRARRRGFVTAGRTNAITGSGTKTFVELGVPNGVTKLTVWMIGGGAGAGGGMYYESLGSSAYYYNVASAGGGGSGRVNTFVMDINPFDTFAYQCGGGGASGQNYDYYHDSDGTETKAQTSGVSGGSTVLTYNGTTYTASGGSVSANTGTTSGNYTHNATDGGSGGSGGGGGYIEVYKYTSSDIPYFHESTRGAGGYNGGNGYASTRVDGSPELKSGGSGGGIPTRPFEIASLECGAGGNSTSTLTYGDGGEGKTPNDPSSQYASKGKNGVIFFAWNNGGV